VHIGKELVFQFSVKNNTKEKQTFRLEYAIYYLRQNGSLSKKVFKISERVYEAGEHYDVVKKHSFSIITTRAFYPGMQKLSVILNGDEHEYAPFELV
jgi:hypothetical protein